MKTTLTLFILMVLFSPLRAQNEVYFASTPSM
ncbi:MAG: hypothetical protein ACJAZV_002119, partial [Roseivirga sp.]